MTDTTSLEVIERETGENPRHTIIWLHGLGADGHDFEPIVPELQLPPDVPIRFIFPHAPHQAITVNGGMVMRAWYDVLDMQIERDIDVDGVERSRNLLEHLVALEIERGIESENVILAGFSQGGAIVLQTGLLYPKTLGGIIAISTYMPIRSRIRSPETDSNQQIPIFMAHGTADPVVPSNLGVDSHAFLESRGYAVEWHTYPMGHSVCIEEIRAIGQWLGKRLRL